MRTLVFILLVSSTSALTLPFADAELQCDRGSLLDCARHALAEEPRLNASAQELVVVGLENLIARSPGAQIETSWLPLRVYGYQNRHQRLM